MRMEQIIDTNNIVSLRPIIEFHELANALPLLDGAEFQEMVASIRQRGQIHPIVLHEGRILDGRNRYRACLDAGKPPWTTTLPDGTDPVDFVIDANIVRRQLTQSQKGWAVQHYATYKTGRPRMQPEHEKIPSRDGISPLTVEEAAQKAGVSTKTVERAKFCAEHGTEDEKQAIRHGKATVKEIEREIRARGYNGTGQEIQPSPQRSAEAISNRYRVKVPDGLTLSEWCRQGVRLEREGGLTLDEIVAEIKMPMQTYRQARDIVLLYERADLNSEDRFTVARALQLMDTECIIAKPSEMIDSIRKRIWPDRTQRHGGDKRRLESFKHAIIAIETACERAAELEVPHLSGEEGDEIRRQLKAAQKNLQTLIMKVARKSI